MICFPELFNNNCVKPLKDEEDYVQVPKSDFEIVVTVEPVMSDLEMKTCIENDDVVVILEDDDLNLKETAL